MITVISATNRPESKSLVIARHYASLLESMNTDFELISLEELPRDFVFEDLYGTKSERFNQIIDRYIAKADKLVFIIPEYNGSFPGILKCFLDGIHPRIIRDKKAGIVGVSDGHAGNLRGQEHLTGILHYLRVHVHYNKPKISNVDDIVNENNQITDERVIRLLTEHAALMAGW